MATVLTTEQLNETCRTPGTIEVPAPTAWPFILAFGATLLFAGLVTSMSVSVLGAALALKRVGIHHAIDDLLVGAEHAGLPQHRVDQSGFTVIDVRDDR